MDKYDVSNDRYCYFNTSVLINKLNIQNMIDLENAEREITSITIQDIVFKKPPYDLEYMKKLHKQLFSQLYDWAGINRREWQQANIDGVNVNYEPMRKIFERIVKDNL